MAAAAPKIQRILLKLSGEALAGGKPHGFDRPAMQAVAEELRPVLAAGVQVGLVVGGGNLFRGLPAAADGADRATADYIGMLATVMNALALHEALETAGLPARVMSALAVTGVAEPFIRAKALAHLAKGRVVLFAGGTGNPYFTTDTAACVRALDIGAQLLLKSTKVDGVYDADPVLHPTASRYEQLDYDEVLQRHLGVMDATAVVLAREHGLPVRVFDMHSRGALARIVRGEAVGTLMSASASDRSGR
ncbi:UMP kinase [Immundisolibacter sp.]|uniref:UMP kinase n=2 Tax=Immundisolibacter sp. TaxID=1934948 RepID=UPI0035665FE4